jgi:hypothetical protein
MEITIWVNIMNFQDNINYLINEISAQQQEAVVVVY